MPKSVISYSSLLTQVRKTLLEGQQRIEAERVRTYWETGRIILRDILNHRNSVEYGKEVVIRLAKDLDIGETVLYRCLQFAQKYPHLPKVAGRQLFNWSHYRQLMAISDEKKRLSLEKSILENEWTADELAARIKEEKPEVSTTSPSSAPAKQELLKPLRGILYNYRLIQRPTLSKDVEPELLVDLGFGVFQAVDTKLVAAFKADQIVESRPKEDAYKFYSVERDAKSLFTYQAFIEKVIDGDTLKVRLDLGFNVWIRQILRLRDLDCPEVKTSAGDEAKAFVQSHLKEAQRIIIRSSKSDKYDRYLADIFIPTTDEADSETDIYLNNLLLERGYAKRWVV